MKNVSALIVLKIEKGFLLEQRNISGATFKIKKKNIIYPFIYFPAMLCYSGAHYSGSSILGSGSVHH